MSLYLQIPEREAARCQRDIKFAPISSESAACVALTPAVIYYRSNTNMSSFSMPAIALPLVIERISWLCIIKPVISLSTLNTFIYFSLSLYPPLSLSLSSGMDIAMATVDPVWSSCCRM